MIPTTSVSAAKKVKLNKTKVTINEGKTVTLKLKKIRIWKITSPLPGSDRQRACYFLLFINLLIHQRDIHHHHHLHQ